MGGREGNVGGQADGWQPGGMARQLHATLDGGTWRGVASSGVERRRVVLASMAPTAPVASMASTAPVATMASMATMVVLVVFVDFVSSMTSMEAHEDTDVKAFLLLKVVGCCDNWSD